MRLKGKLNRVEGQLARERKEKDKVSSLLAKRDEELVQLHHQLAPTLAGQTDDPRPSEDSSVSSSAPGSRTRVPLSVFLARSRRLPRTALTPFLEWWKDVNGRRADSATSDPSIMVWWTVVAGLLLLTFLQLCWVTDEDIEQVADRVVPTEETAIAGPIPNEGN